MTVALPSAYKYCFPAFYGATVTQLVTSAMPPPVRGRRRRRRSPSELVFGFSPEGRRREEAFYLSLDGNAQIEELLEHDRMAEEQELLERDRLAEEQRITDLRRQRDMEQQRIDALHHPLPTPPLARQRMSSKRHRCTPLCGGTVALPSRR